MGKVDQRGVKRRERRCDGMVIGPFSVQAQVQVSVEGLCLSLQVLPSPSMGLG